MRVFTPLFVGFLLVQLATAQEPSAQPRRPQISAKRANLADSLHKMVVYRIKNVPAEEVAQAVNHELSTMFDEKPKHEGFVVKSAAVIIPDVKSNSLMVIAIPSYMDKISDMIHRLDKSPKQILIQLIVQEIEDGKVTTLTRPQVLTLDGTEAIIEVGSEKKTLRIRLTPQVIQGDDK